MISDLISVCVLRVYIINISYKTEKENQKYRSYFANIIVYTFTKKQIFVSVRL